VAAESGDIETVNDYRITPSGRLAVFLARSASGELLPITSVVVPPKVSVGGATAAGVNSMIFGTPASKVEPWIALQLRDAVKPGDVVTCGAPAGWALTASGPLPAIPDGTPMANYVGSMEPEFVIPDQPTLKLGTNVGALTTAPYYPYRSPRTGGAAPAAGKGRTSSRRPTAS
jgi:hypothetical protein